MKTMTAETYIISILTSYLKERNISNISVNIEKPKQKNFGDFSTNLALQLASILKTNPHKIAEELKSNLKFDPKIISKIEIAGPGFINFYISESSIYNSLFQLLKEEKKYGTSNIGKRKKTQVEFISANPTGPLTIGHGRQAVLGDTISRLLEACGFNVTREYYFNNAGRQMRILGESVRLRYLELLGEKIDFPDDHYRGEYIIEIAKSIYDEFKDKYNDNQDINFFTKRAEESVFNDIKNTIKRLKFEMDVFYNENTLYDEGKIDKVLQLLRKKNLIAEKDGAVGFLSSQLGMDQDRVMVKSTGEPTYRLPDIAYHREKILRGFDLIVDIFGADHIATYPDVLLALKALDIDEQKIKVLIHQFVTLTENGKKIKMSTRKANFVTLDELMDEVGEDVTRFFFLMRHMNSHLNFDLKLAKTQSDENPVYYVQYAHARICSIIRFGEENNIIFKDDAPLQLLIKAEEIELIKHLLEFPKIIEISATNFEPHRLVNYLIETATFFHKFYTECRVITDDSNLTQARLALCKATKIVLSNGCSLLGITAPEKM
ncbi:arginine--tRNA ligase [Calditrichota bacterium]